VAKEAQPRKLGCRVLGIVDEQVGVTGQRDGRFVINTGAVRTRAEGRRAVIWKVSQRVKPSLTR
jgi:hypothetical protein